MKIQNPSRVRRQAGYSALFITLILVGASVLLLGSTLSRTTASTRLNDRNALYLSTEGAAEAAVEKVLSRMMVDFANSGEGLIQSNLTLYRTGLLPNTNESPYWSNFIFSDGTGNSNAVYVCRTTTSANAPYIALSEQYAGLSGYASTYEIMANAQMASSTYNYSFSNAVEYQIQLAQIPVFQFAIFYNGTMEFSDCATMVINGPVHCNTNIYVGSSAPLTFNSIVTASGNITDPANAGYGQSSWTAAVTYNGSPSPGYLTGQPTLTLPIGTNSTVGSNVQQILYPPVSGDSVAMSSQRYYNKAHMVLWISNNNNFYATFKSSSADPSPITFSTNISMLTSNYWLTNTLVNSGPAMCATNWGQYWGWLSTTNVFYDFRETAYAQLTQIDVGKLNIWLTNWLTASWNTNVAAKFNVNNPFNIIYVADWRYTNATAPGALNFSAVRLMDGAVIPANGLTVSTPNPLYIWGLYNCPSASYQNTSNTTGLPPTSVACDAITILSPNWLDSRATSSSSSKMPAASSDTVTTAIITGNVTTTGTTGSTYSGGANNLTRLLESWSGDYLWLNTSLVCLYNSTWANTQFQMPGNYYEPPTREFSFNLNYTNSSGMPPGTPNICRGIRAVWCNPTPGDTNFNYSFQTDYVPN